MTLEIHDELSAPVARHRIANTRGPTFKFTGRLLAEYETDDHHRSDRWYRQEVFETEGGAWIAVTTSASDAEGERDFVDAIVVKQDKPEIERICAVMEHFRWSAMARSMAKKLKWSLNVEVA